MSNPASNPENAAPQAQNTATAITATPKVVARGKGVWIVGRKAPRGGEAEPDQQPKPRRKAKQQQEEKPLYYALGLRVAGEGLGRSVRSPKISVDESEAKAARNQVADLRRFALDSAAHPVPPTAAIAWANHPSRAALRKWLKDHGLFRSEWLPVSEQPKPPPSPPVAPLVERFAAHCATKNNREKRGREVSVKLETLFKRAGIVTVGDLTKAKVQAGIEAITGEFEDTTIAAYRATLNQFLEWAADGGSIAAEFRVRNKGNTKNSRTHNRRPLSAMEQLWLVWATEEHGVTFAGKTWSVTGRDRAMLYRVALAIGARASECMTLVVGNLELSSSLTARPGESAGPGITLDGELTKSREPARIPIQQSLAALLREYVRGRPANARLFPACPTEKLAKRLRADLGLARKLWLEHVARTTPSDYEDLERLPILRSLPGRGRVVDFHALRHTFIQNLVDAGIDVNTVQALARHADVTTTLTFYASTTPEKKAQAVAKLPDLSTPPPTLLPGAAEMAA